MKTTTKKNKNLIIRSCPPLKKGGWGGFVYILSLLFALCLLQFPLTLRADSAAAGQLEGVLNGIGSMQGNFTQKIYNSRGGVIRSASGRMAMSRPGLFRWEVLSPTPQLVIANTKNVWVYDSGLKQVQVKRVNRSNATPAMLLSSSSRSILKAFNVNKENDWFILQPKRQDISFQVISLRFAGNRLLEMNLVDKVGQQTVVSFSGMRVNSKISPQTFQFALPKGVDVIQG